MSMCERLRDRVAVITGAGSGIGLASARRLAEEGARVVAVDIDEAAGATAAAEVDGLFVRADVASEADVEAAFATVFDTYGAIDVSFHNAGHLAARRRLDPHHVDRDVATRARRQPRSRCTSAAST